MTQPPALIPAPLIVESPKFLINWSRLLVHFPLVLSLLLLRRLSVLMILQSMIDNPLAPLLFMHLSDPTVQTARYSRQRDAIGVGASRPTLDIIVRLVLVWLSAYHIMVSHCSFIFQAQNGYCVTLVLRNPLYLAPPSANDPNTGAPADAAGPAGPAGAVSTRGSVLNNAQRIR
ncbi:hypothetical protein IW262DRAFT_105588 [Armillaria fumosa]|nr:hypothetical protein IW262DRAFT_105588 [Armillaria fumosa]